MTAPSQFSEIPENKADQNAAADSDNEGDIFHDARFPADEEAVSPPSLFCLYRC